MAGLLNPRSRKDVRNNSFGDYAEGLLSNAGNSVKDWYTGMHPMDQAAVATAPIPILGDITGAAADARMFYEEPESRTWANAGMSAAGLLPFVPALSVARQSNGLLDDLVESFQPQKDTLKEMYSTKGFRSDIPDDDWLQGKINKVNAAGPDEWGNNPVNTVTGYYHGDVTPTVPLSELKKLKGTMGEHTFTRGDSLDAIRKIMRETGSLPKTRDGSDYRPFITVDHAGTPIISEGNHRIKAAIAEGWEDMPVEVRYYDGGERNATGVWRPSTLFNDIGK